MRLAAILKELNTTGRQPTGLAGIIARLNIVPFRLPGTSVLGFSCSGRPQWVRLRAGMTRSEVIGCIKMACAVEALEAVKVCDEKLRAGDVDEKTTSSTRAFGVLVRAFRACVRTDGVWLRVTIAYEDADFNERRSRGEFCQLRGYFAPKGPKAQQRASDKLNRVVIDLERASSLGVKSHRDLVEAFAECYAPAEPAS